MEDTSLEQQLSSLELSILSTLVYFDLFDYPLTSVEIHKWLYEQGFSHEGDKEFSLEEVVRTLQENVNISSFIESEHGFWTLKGRKEIAYTREERYKLAQSKYNHLLKVIRLIKWCPFTRAIFVTNTLSYNNTQHESDIDLLLIASKEKLWTVRFFWNTILTLMRMRPGQSHARKDKICINFIVSDKRLSLKEVSLRNRRYEVVDVHLAHLFSTLIPLYDPLHLIKRFSMENSWTRTFFRYVYLSRVSDGRVQKDRIINVFVKKFFEYMLSHQLFEEKLRNFQLRIMPHALKQAALEEKNVIFSPDVLKFHLHDRRREILRMFQQKLAEWGKRIEGKYTN